MQPMDTKIRSVVELFHYPMWFIKLDKDVTCPCIDHASKEPKHDCPICLGTGYKIKVVRSKAARQTTETASMRGIGLGYGEKNASDIYFSITDLELQEGDIIVDNGHTDIVQYYAPGRTNDNKPVYYRIHAIRKNIDNGKFLIAFNNLLKRNGYGSEH